MFEVVLWILVSAAIWLALIATGLIGLFTAPLALLRGGNKEFR